jgi:hypothetical protein
LSIAAPETGRIDALLLLQWLRIRKGVERIMKVTVHDDDGSTPHSNEAIQRVILGFGVEILDWRKIDLCPDTVFIACKSIRQLHLYWSGSNTVFRAWSEPEGLASLKCLRNVNVHMVPYPEPANKKDGFLKF